MYLKLKVMGALFSQYNIQALFKRWKENADAKTAALEVAKMKMEKNAKSSKNDIAVISIKVDKSKAKNKKMKTNNKHRKSSSTKNLKKIL